MHDLIIKGGTLVDGTGAAARPADVAVDSGRITDVGQIEGGATRTIDADGLLVTPGWVDVHTHYDGQATWDSELAPSSWHGVTTLVMGNCGVGFAPAQPDRHDWLIGLMEGVEDIPGTALAEGIEWEWETFPEYLDALERRRWTVDVGTQVPHGAVRAYVMGERGAAQRGGDRRGHRGHAVHRARGAPGGRPRLLDLAHHRPPRHRRRGRAGHLRRRRRALRPRRARWARRAPACSSWHRSARPANNPRTSWARWTGCAGSRRRSTGPCPSHSCRSTPRRTCGASSWPSRSRRVPRAPSSTRRWRGVRPGCSPATTPRSASSPTSRPTARCAPAGSPPPSSARRWPTPRCAGPSCRGRPRRPAVAEAMKKAYERTFVLGDPPDYEPGPERSLAGLAAARGVSPLEVAYDEMAKDGGTGLLYLPILNYATGDLDHVYDMLLHPQGLLGLSDGGAHTGTICDGSMPTFMLTHWTRDRQRGATLPLEYVVKKQTHDTARLYGMSDRGTIEPGALADFNLIDYDALFARRALRAGRPAGRRAAACSRRQSGYVATIKKGTVTFEHGEPTGELPGRLVRGAR